MGYKILIVDDDHSFRKIVEIRLKSFLNAPEFTTFDSLSQARAFLKQEQEKGGAAIQFDLVVLDEHLPDGRGRDFLAEGWFRDIGVLSMSSDPAPEIPGGAISAGATFFLEKRCVSEPLFQPLVAGVIERNRLQRELNAAEMKSVVVDTVRTLVGTLRHEINNPLGAVLGAAYLFQRDENLQGDAKEAATLIEQSGKRIKHVLDRLCDTLELQTVSKADLPVFHVPGDKKWES